MTVGDYTRVNFVDDVTELNQTNMNNLDAKIEELDTFADAIPLDNLTATTDPTVNEDSGDGYGVGSSWANVTLDKFFVCVDATVGAAVWNDTGVASGSVLKTDYNAHTILQATSNNLPVAITIAEQRIVGRITAGNIKALTAAEVLTLIGVENGATADQIASEVPNTPAGNVAATDVQAAINELDTEKESTTTSHASRHVTGGGDVIANAIAAGNSGLMSGVDKTKLNDLSKSSTVVVGKSGAVDYLTTDYGSDNACIQAAIDYVNGLGGGSVLIREGTYTIESTLTVGTNTMLSGVGWSTSLSLANNVNDNIITNKDHTSGNEGIVISNLELIGNHANQTSGHGIYFNKALRGKIENCRILYLKESGIYVVGLGCVWISNCTSRGNQQHGIIFASGSSDSFIMNCDVGSNVFTGITLTSTGFLKLIGNNIWLNEKGIDLYNTNRNFISNNMFNANTTDIQIRSTTGVLYGHNNISSNSSVDATTGMSIIVDAGATMEGLIVSNNNFSNAGTPISKTINGTLLNTRIINNHPYNPIGNFPAPSVPATTVNYTNAYGYPCQVQVYGGTVSEIDIDDIATGLTSGIFIIPPGGTINITYSAAPSWRWWGL